MRKIDPQEWARFDSLVAQAYRIREEGEQWAIQKAKEYGNDPFDGTVLSGGAFPNWSREDKAENRRRLNDYYAAHDAAIAARPKRTRKETARKRFTYLCSRFEFEDMKINNH
jgi:hypothetical protein